MGCYKKGDRSLFAAYKEDSSIFDFALRMERFENFVPMERQAVMMEKGKVVPERMTMYRHNRSATEMLEAAKKWNGTARDERQNTTVQFDLFEDESCDIYSNCGE
jgi:hypothetical protein